VNAVANPLSRTRAQFDVELHNVPNSVNPNVSHLLSVTFFARLLHNGVLKKNHQLKSEEKINKSLPCKKYSCIMFFVFIRITLPFTKSS
jgi:hypothetical protein